MSKLFDINMEDVGGYNSPKDIIDEQCGYLKDATKDFVLGRTQDYSGEITDHIRLGARSPMKALTIMWSDQKDEEIAIQSQLGELSEGVFTFDFFLTSIYTPNYKYRVLFFRYGIGGYPVKVVVDKDIANEIDCTTEISCNSEEEFIEYLGKVLKTHKFQEIVKNLYSYCVKQQNEQLPF